jgi:PPOX class probable F420-dependent enzyme
MTDEERRSFLTETAHTAKAATVRADGSPHVTPVWIALDSDDVLFTTGSNSVKARDIRRDPRICLCVDDEAPPFSFVMIEGTATISDDLAELRHWAAIIGGRYMGADRAEEFGARNGVPGEVLVRVSPTKITAEADIAD